MKTRQILVIENDESIQAITKVSLEIKVGWYVIQAFSGKQGVIKAEIYQPDVILLDVLPNLNGLDILKQLNLNFRTKSIPVILFTTQVKQSYLLQLTKNRVAGVIIKPFDVLTLANQIVQILNWQYQNTTKLLNPK